MARRTGGQADRRTGESDPASIASRIAAVYPTVRLSACPPVRLSVRLLRHHDLRLHRRVDRALILERPLLLEGEAEAVARLDGLRLERVRDERAVLGDDRVLRLVVVDPLHRG